MTRLRAALCGAAALALTAPLTAQSYRTLTASRERTSESQFNVIVDFAVGRFTLRPNTGRALFTEAVVFDEEKFGPRGGYDAAAHTLTAGIATLRHGTNISYPNGRTKQALDLTLSPNVPTSLQFKFGAVTADMDLGGLSMTDATIETGASETHIRFDKPNRVRCRYLMMTVGAAQFTVAGLGNARCDDIRLKGGVGDLTLDFTGVWDPGTTTATHVEMGLGSLTLRLPEELGIAVSLQKFLTSFDTAGFIKRGSTYYSKNYDSAATKLSINVSAAIGNIDVEWIRR